MLWYTDCNMSYVSQHWQQYVIRITTLTKICLMCHNTNNTMSCVPQRKQQVMRKSTLLSMLWYVRYIVVSVVIRKMHCCQCSDTKDKLLYHDNNMSYVSQHFQKYVIRITTLTTICLTYHNTDNNMSYISQHWHQYVLRITIRKIYCCQCCDT
jgi:acyl carrier protein phosphodiesterase